MTKNNIINIIEFKYPLLKNVLKFCIEIDNVSTAQIQRKFNLSYPRTSMLIDTMDELGYISYIQAKILITKEEFTNIFGDVYD